MLFTLLIVSAAAFSVKAWNATTFVNCLGTNTAGCTDPIVGSNGAAVTEVGTCSEVGVDILQQGGNAADAIIAAGFCVGVISAYHSGIGGGGFGLVRFNEDNSSHGYETIDFRETMPAAGNETMYSSYGVNQTKSTIGGLAVGVPGDLRGKQLLHDRHGVLPWSKLVQPSIDIARGGFPVNVDLATEIQAGKSFILNDSLWSEMYAPNGTLLGLGDTCYRHRYADTLEIIANDGVDAFYANTTIASNIISAVQSTGGIMTADDLAGYEAIVREAVTIQYRNTRIYSTVAPSSGSVVLSALKVFEGYPGSAQRDDPAINLTTHRLVEANKFAYGQRGTLGDPAFIPNVTFLEQEYLTDPVVSAVRSRIKDNATFPNSYYDPSGYYPTRESGTSHMATVDKDGMSVSLTTTINLIWGSRVITQDGIILNDEMDDFSSPGEVNSFGFAASPINFIAGGKRPLSSIASSIVEDGETGEILMATGSAGGSEIITATLQQLHHYIDQSYNASQSTNASRWHDQLAGYTQFELSNPSDGVIGYDNRTVAFFRELGTNVTYKDSGATSHAIGRLPSGEFLAASDPRRPAGRGAAY